MSTSDNTDNLVILNHQEQANLEEVSLNSNGQCFNVSERDNVHFVNHVQINETSEEFDKLLAEGSPECETFEAGEESEGTGALETNSTLPTEDVQTLPLRPTAEETNDLRSTLSESRNFDCNLNDLVAEKIQLSNSTLVLDKDISSDSSSDLITIKRADNFKVSASGGSQHAEKRKKKEVSKRVEAESTRMRGAATAFALIVFWFCSDFSSYYEVCVYRISCTG
uniref:Uncharacterized protein n=1 Tax=Chenopodium quinoa TaxID=63459 RepID=A0A803MIS2_CHEQI